MTSAGGDDTLFGGERRRPALRRHRQHHGRRPAGRWHDDRRAATTVSTAATATTCSTATPAATSPSMGAGFFPGMASGDEDTLDGGADDDDVLYGDAGGILTARTIQRWAATTRLTGGNERLGHPLRRCRRRRALWRRQPKHLRRRRPSFGRRRQSDRRRRQALRRCRRQAALRRRRRQRHAMGDGGDDVLYGDDGGDDSIFGTGSGGRYDRLDGGDGPRRARRRTPSGPNTAKITASTART